MNINDIFNEDNEQIDNEKEATNYALQYAKMLIEEAVGTREQADNTPPRSVNSFEELFKLNGRNNCIYFRYLLTRDLKFAGVVFKIYLYFDYNGENYGKVIEVDTQLDYDNEGYLSKQEGHICWSGSPEDCTYLDSKTYDLVNKYFLQKFNETLAERRK